MGYGTWYCMKLKRNMFLYGNVFILYWVMYCGLFEIRHIDIV